MSRPFITTENVYRSSIIHHNFQSQAPASLQGGNTVRLPSHEEIAQRAFEIYVAGGRQSGQSEQDWLQAERELLAIAVAQGDEQFADEDVDDEPAECFAFPRSTRYPMNFSGMTSRSIVNIA